MGELRTRAIRTVLAVDDDEILLAAYRRGVDRQRSLFTASNPTTARQIARRESPELAVIDLRISTDSGIDLVRDLKRERPDMVIVLCSAYLSVVATEAAMKAGAYCVMFKPITLEEIVRRVEEDTPVELDLEETPTLARVEWEHITRVLADCNGNISMAARRLGIYRSSLQRRLRKHAPRE
jgi:two-component system, response regulator RegA